MIVSEYNFEHLRHAEEEQLKRELEYRRIAHERRAESGTTGRREGRGILRRFRHSTPAHSSVLSPAR